MPSWPLQRIGEVLIDGQWVSMPLREETRVTITRGIGAEGSVARPGSMTVRVNDPDALYSTRNAESALYGKFGQGSQVRFRVDDVPSPAAAVLADTFDRTVSNGWGSSTSGTSWVIWDPLGISPPAAEFAVSGGRGTISPATKSSSRYIRTSGLALADYEATFTFATDTQPQDGTAENGIVLSAALRINAANTTCYLANVVLMPNAGLPGTLGLRVATNFAAFDVSNVTPYNQVPGLVWAPGVRLRARVRVEGGDMRIRVWTDGTQEPENWHGQFYDGQYTQGEFGFRTIVLGSGTTVPATTSIDDVDVRPLTADTGAVRILGEIAGLDPYEDEHGPASGRVDLDVAGALRRYDGPQKPIRSALRRRLAVYAPRGYWSFEEGAQGDTRVAEVGLQSTTGPLAVSGLDFARDDTLVGSAPLPTVKAGGTLRVDSIQGDNTGNWSVYCMIRLTTSGFPTDGNHHQILRFSTGTATFTLTARTVGGVPGLYLNGVLADGTDLGTQGVSLTGVASIGKTFLDRWQQVKVYASQSGTDTTAGLGLNYPDGAGWFNDLSPATFAADRPRRIHTTFGTGVQDMGIGHLAVFGVLRTSAFTNFNAATPISYEVGAPGLRARDWMSFLSCDQALVLDVYGPGETKLGPYPRESFIALVQAAAETDAGLLVEHRDRIGLRYVTRQALYNKPVDLVLDYSSGMVFAPFEPKDDDKDLINVLTVRRRAGSEETAQVTKGRRSVQLPPAGIGVKDASVETIVESDSQLPGQAGWRLNVATWDEMRVASVTLRMSNPRLRPLIDTVLKLREGSRVQIINTPRRYGVDGFDLMVRGTKEIHGEGIFDLTLACVPYGPYLVGGVAYLEDFEDTTYSVTLANAGTLPWLRTNAQAHTGTWSMRSGAITNNQTSDLLVTVPPGQTELRFWYWTSSEGSGAGFEGDRLLVLVDGTQVLRAQGTTPWTQAIVDVTGRSVVTFRYVKDNSTAVGSDFVAIDNLQFTGRAPARVDTDSSQLALAATSSATTLLVHTPSTDAVERQPWITTAGLDTSHPGEFPFACRLGGEVVQVGAIEPAAWDAFTRTVSNGWGSSSSGHAWAETGGVASDRGIGGTVGSITLTSPPDTIRFQRVTPETIGDCEVVARMRVSAVATGASIVPAILLRYVDINNYYRARLHFDVGGGLSATITRDTTVVATSASLGTYAAGDWFWVKARLTGHRIQMRVWRLNTPEPTVWHLDATVTASTIAAGTVGLSASAFPGNTNVSPVLGYDDFQVRTPQRWTVTRAQNGVNKSQSAGTAVSLAQPAIVAL